MGYLWAKYEGSQFFKHVPHFLDFTRSSGTFSLNPLTPKFSPKNAVLTFNSVFGCHDTTWALVCWKTYFLTKNINIWKIRYKNVHFAIACSELFSFNVPFHLIFSSLSLSLDFAFHTCILSGCRKKLGPDYEQSLEMGPWSIICIMGHFATNFCSTENC